MNKLNRIKELVKLLNKYRDEYYNQSNPSISDKEYDELFDELTELEKETGIYFSNSPTQTVGYEVKSELKKVTHSHLMQSLDKTKSVDDLKKFVNDHCCVLSLKMDGLTILLTYENGELIQAETRGNGEVGEDITHNARVFENIPLQIDYKGHIEFEGEAIITYDDFEKINSLIKNQDDKYKNPRNLASGSARQLDSSIAAQRHIKFILWKVPIEEDSMIASFQDAKDLGFEVVPYAGIPAGADKDSIEKIIDILKKEAQKLGYPIDGLVMSYNNVTYGKSLGYTGHHPKHSIAFKFYDEEIETKLLNIEWTMGKTGTLCPTAVFEPVDIDGTTVERASLHNISIMKKLELSYGDTITVYKANAIIPQIADNIDKSMSNICVPPSICPICGEPTEIRNDNGTEVLYCTSDLCKGKLLGKLNAFVSKQGMDITGLSESTLELLVNKGFIKSYKDIFHLNEHKTELSTLPRMGAKSVAKLLKSIENSRKTTLDKYLASLSIPLIGKSTARDISNYCHNSIDEFIFIMENTSLEFAAIDGVGVAATTSLDDWWQENREMFYLLLEELKVELPEEKTEIINGNILKDMNFVITGSVYHFKNRSELQAKIESLGGKVISSVNAKTNILINNDINSNSSKNLKAKSLSIPIWNETQFLKFIGETN